MHPVTVHLPDELLEALAAPGVDISRAAFEALAAEAYREQKISHSQLRRLLGYETRMEFDAFLKPGASNLSTLSKISSATAERFANSASKCGLL